MLSKLLRFGLLGFLLTGCSTLTHLQNSMFPSTSSTAKQNAAATPATAPTTVGPAKHVALLLPLSGDLANAGSAIQAGFNDEYQSNPNKPTVKVYDTSQATAINDLYDQAANDGADYIVGPLDKTNVANLQSRGDIKVITIALNSTGNASNSPDFYQFGLSPTDEAQLAADKASQDGHHSALLITPSGSWGDGIANALRQRWQSDGGVIVGSVSVSNNSNLTSQIRQLLQVNGQTRRQDIDAIFLITQPVLARQIKPLLKFYFAGDVPVYSTSLIYTGWTNTAADQDLNGVEFCDMPLVLAQQGQWSQVRQQLTLSQPATMQQYIRLYGLGWDAALLTQEFNQLPNGISGATGSLYTDNQQRILRHLPWAVFQNGNATVM